MVVFSLVGHDSYNGWTDDLATILLNKEVIAVSQDALGKQGKLTHELYSSSRPEGGSEGDAKADSRRAEGGSEGEGTVEGRGAGGRGRPGKVGGGGGGGNGTAVVVQMYTRELAGGDLAVAVFSRGAANMSNVHVKVRQRHLVSSCFVRRRAA